MDAHRSLRALDRPTSWICGTFLFTSYLRWVKDKTRSSFSSTSSRVPHNSKGSSSNSCARNRSVIKAKTFCHGYPGSTPKRFPSYASHTITHLLHLFSGCFERPISRRWLSGSIPLRWWALYDMCSLIWQAYYIIEPNQPAPGHSTRTRRALDGITIIQHRDSEWTGEGPTSSACRLEVAPYQNSGGQLWFLLKVTILVIEVCLGQWLRSENSTVLEGRLSGALHLSSTQWSTDTRTDILEVWSTSWSASSIRRAIDGV